MLNKSIIIGNLARDPEGRKVGDNSVVNLVVAVNDIYKKDKTYYIDVEAWGKLAENCEKYLSKGRQVAVEGRIIKDLWKGENDETKSKVYIKADNVQFLSGGGKAEEKESEPPKQNKQKQEKSDDLTEDEIPF